MSSFHSQFFCYFHYTLCALFTSQPRCWMGIFCRRKKRETMMLHRVKYHTHTHTLMSRLNYIFMQLTSLSLISRCQGLFAGSETINHECHTRLLPGVCLCCHSHCWRRLYMAEQLFSRGSRGRILSNKRLITNFKCHVYRCLSDV